MFLIDSCLMKDSIDLYDNIASIGDCQGRLKTTFHINPAPGIMWDFESVGDFACEPASLNGKLKNPIIGHNHTIQEAYLNPMSTWSSNDGKIRRMVGSSPSAFYGQLDIKCNSFLFALPNCKFQVTSKSGQNFLENEVSIKNKQSKEIYSSSSVGRFFKTKFQDNWTIELVIENDAFNWLSNQTIKQGTFLTTIGRYYYGDVSNNNEIPEDQKISLEEGLNKIDRLTLLISFANGGLIAPLIFETANEFPEYKNHKIFTPYPITPIEQIGTSWALFDSDIKSFINCFPAFERMLQKEIWSERFGIVLMWYFQVIQPQSLQMQGKPWPVIANALGALLELLFYIICIEEETDNEKKAYCLKKLNSQKSSEERISLLLDKIGVDTYIEKTFLFGKEEPKNFIALFRQLRNDATHPIQKRKDFDPDDGIDYVLQQATQWVEEVILWRIGYSGKYRDRFRNGRKSREPRYDLSKRDSSW